MLLSSEATSAGGVAGKAANVVTLLLCISNLASDLEPEVTPNASLTLPVIEEIMESVGPTSLLLEEKLNTGATVDSFGRVDALNEGS